MLAEGGLVANPTKEKNPLVDFEIDPATQGSGADNYIDQVDIEIEKNGISKEEEKLFEWRVCEEAFSDHEEGLIDEIDIPCYCWDFVDNLAIQVHCRYGRF